MIRCRAAFCVANATTRTQRRRRRPGRPAHQGQTSTAYQPASNIICGYCPSHASSPRRGRPQTTQRAKTSSGPSEVVRGRSPNQAQATCPSGTPQAFDRAMPTTSTPAALLADLHLQRERLRYDHPASKSSIATASRFSLRPPDARLSYEGWNQGSALAPREEARNHSYEQKTLNSSRGARGLR